MSLPTVEQTAETILEIITESLSIRGLCEGSKKITLCTINCCKAFPTHTEQMLRCLPCGFFYACMYTKPLQSCPPLCDPMDCDPPGSSVHGISQARILEWVAMPSSGGSFQPGIKPRSPILQADSLLSEPPGKPMNTGIGSLSLL